MTTYIDNRTILIVGASSGIGHEAMKLLINTGATVVNIDKSTTDFQHSQLINYHCDLSDRVATEKIAELITQEHKTIDGYFYAAGIHHNEFLENTDLSIIDHMLQVNVYGAIIFAKKLLPIMKERRSGTILLMGSEQSIIASHRNSIYAMTKAALSQLTRSLAIDTAEYGIRVNCINPGTTDTNMFRHAVSLSSKRTGLTSKEIIDDTSDSIPLKRIAEPKEIAELAVFLLSDKSSYMTGSNVVIDGGFTIQ